MPPYAPLAIDINGELFDVGDEAVAWRVRRLSKSGKGTPETLFRDGARLTIPITSDPEELYEVLRHCIDDDIGGKYRLDLIDDEGCSLEGPSAYAVFGSTPAKPNSVASAESPALTKALECNFRLVNSVVDALKVISTQYAAAMESSAKAASLRAQNAQDIDQSSLVPFPMAPVIAEAADDDDDKTKHTVDWTPIVEQCAPIVSQLGALAAAKLGSKMMGTPQGSGPARPAAPIPEDD